MKTSSVDGRGQEPVLTNEATPSQIGDAYNYYNSGEHDKVLPYILTYLNKIKFDKRGIIGIEKTDLFKIPNYLGWNCRLLTTGNLPEEVRIKTISKIKELAIATLTNHKKKKVVIVDSKPKLTVQDHIKNAAMEIIADIENIVDKFVQGTLDKNFSWYKWFSDNQVKSIHAKYIIEYYTPMLEHYQEILKGKDKQLNEGYSDLSTLRKKRWVKFWESLLNDVKLLKGTSKTRKVRTIKQKSATQLASKLKYQLEDIDKYKVKSINPESIVGANQLWTFNTKTRILTSYIADENSPLTIKGTTVLGFNLKLSIAKKLRKPEVVIDNVIKITKPSLKKIMDLVGTKPSKLSGRINQDTLLLRVVK